MNQYCGNRSWVIWLSFLVAIILEQMPCPKQFIYYKPAWLILILIYWVMALPHRISVGSGFFLGIVMDLIQGITLGIHALTNSMICYLVSYKYQLFRNMEMWQQSFVIFGLSVIMNFTIFLIEFFSSIVLFHPEIFLNCLINGVLWPWIFVFLRKVRRRFLIR
ncbi:rod shape-determining protein MreD [Arsenophonus symbiont of Ornithomya chloropus]|uniref:rod shape-determining protein MreD n=1 Tax=Arsenophonus symbiont of Ornithomya chloropus TaxID=634121 RepID=UPI0032B2ABFA